MSVDVIIPVRAPAPWLPQALASALGQPMLGRVLLVMDHCTLHDLPPIDAVPRRGMLECLESPGEGPSAARNAGLAAARSPHVVYLDADDQLEPGGLATLQRAANDECPIVVGAWRHIGSDGARLPGGARFDAGMVADPLRWMCESAPPVGPVLLPRSAQRWDEARRVWEVSRFFNRVAACGARLQIVDAMVAAIRQHASPARLSIAQRHFDADVALAFWLEEYRWARELGARGDGACDAIARRLVALASALVRGGAERTSVEAVLALARRDRWVQRLAPRVGSAAWFALRFGIGALDGFHRVNRALRR